MVSSSVSDVRMTATPSDVIGAHQFVDLLLGADVETARRVVQDEHPRLGVQPFRQHHLLLVAARQVEAERVDAGRAHLQPVDPAARPAGAPRARRSGRDGLRLPRSARVMLAATGQEQHQALDAAVARDVADAESTASAGVVSRTSRPPTREPAAVVRGEAGKRAGQLLAARNR